MVKAHIFPSIGNSKNVNQLKSYWYEWRLDDNVLSFSLHQGDLVYENICEISLVDFISPYPNWLGDIVIWNYKDGSSLRVMAFERLLILKFVRVQNASSSIKVGVLPIDYSSKMFQEDEGLIVMIGPTREIHSAENLHLDEMVRYSQEWLDKTPKFTVKSFPQLRTLWDYVWVLHRVNTYEAEGIFKDNWESPCRWSYYQRPMIAMWDTLHIIEDLMVWNNCYALKQMKNHLALYRASDGMIAQDCVGNVDELPAQKEHRVMWSGRNFRISQPPLWAPVIWKLYIQNHDKKYLEQSYRICLNNIKWWEENRGLNGLFTFKDTVSRSWESGYDISPRFDEPESKPFPCIDLSSQMVLYYEYLSIIAGELNDLKEKKSLTRKAELLAENIRTQMWDPEDMFFYDLKIKNGKWIKIKTIASFWPLVAGVASKSQAKALVGHLKNEDEFWGFMPVPSVAMNETDFTLDCWRGPTWVSQNYWIVEGLKRYGYNDLAGELTRKTVDAILEVFNREFKIYEFYNPKTSSIQELTRKGKTIGPHPYYIGHMPLHALILSGLYGVSLDKEGLNVSPVFRYLWPSSQVEFSAGGTKIKLIVEAGKKLVEVWMDGKKLISGETARISWKKFPRRDESK